MFEDRDVFWLLVDGWRSRWLLFFFVFFLQFLFCRLMDLLAALVVGAIVAPVPASLSAALGRDTTGRNQQKARERIIYDAHILYSYLFVHVCIYSI